MHKSGTHGVPHPSGRYKCTETYDLPPIKYHALTGACTRAYSPLHHLLFNAIFTQFL